MTSLKSVIFWGVFSVPHPPPAPFPRVLHESSLGSFVEEVGFSAAGTDMKTGLFYRGLSEIAIFHRDNDH